MILSKEQQALFDGEKGETMAKVVKTLVMYGEAFNAEKMVPITGEYGHTVSSFGSTAIKPVFDLYDRLLSDNMVSNQKFTADPRPLDKNVPSTLLQNIVFKMMYSQQERLEEQLRKLGVMNDDAYTCASFLPQVGNIPKRGDILSWSESSAFVYANSVIGARSNRNSGIIDLMGSIAGFVPEFGYLTDEGRIADWVIEIRTEKMPEAQILGSAVGMRVNEKVPYIKGLDKWIGTELNDTTCSYLRDFGGAAASSGSVGLYHAENLTPEAVDYGEKLIRQGAPVYVIDDAELKRVKDSYLCSWKDLDAKPKICFVGCPHLTLQQLKDWTLSIEEGLRAAGNKKVLISTVFTTAPAVIRAFKETEYATRLETTGVILSYICPLMYMSNPLSSRMPIITSSSKLRTYSSARFYSEDEILKMITKGVK